MNGRGEVIRLQTRLDAAFSRATAAGADIETQSDLAKYLCILTCGYLESAIPELLTEVARKRGAPELSSYVSRSLDRWSTPNPQKIAQLLGSFKSEWRIAAEAFLVDRRKDQLDSLIALRHTLAHGGDAGTSLAYAKDYYANARAVVSFVADLVDPA
jgi:hypothetical protein